MRLWERICEDFGTRICKTFEEDLQGFTETLGEDLQGFTRLLERIRETLGEDS